MALAQWACLEATGLNPVPATWLVGETLFYLTGFVIAPAAALAAVTPLSSRLGWPIVGVLLSGASLWMVRFRAFSHVAWLHTMRYGLAAALLAGVCAAAVVLQYANRRTALGRGVLLAGVLPILLLWPVLAHRHEDASDFPTSFEMVTQPPFAVVPIPGRDVRAILDRAPDGHTIVDLSLPLTFTSGSDAAIHLTSFRLEFEGADGFTWSTTRNGFWPFEYRNGVSLTPGALIPRTVYQRLGASPVTAHLALYYDDLQKIRTVSSTLGQATYKPAPGMYCEHGGSQDWIVCRTASRNTPIVNVNATFSSDPCPASNPVLEQGAANVWSGFGYGEESAEDLVALRQVAFALASDRGNATGGRFLCADAPVTFTQYRVARQVQSTFRFVLPQLPTPDDPYRLSPDTSYPSSL